MNAGAWACFASAIFLLGIATALGRWHVHGQRWPFVLWCALWVIPGVIALVTR